MHIINNRNHNNHLNRIIASFKNADEVIIVSPFMTADFGFFPFNRFRALNKITIITRLKPHTADQYDKVIYLDQLWNYAEQNGIELEILIDNSLHGKIYIAKNSGHFREGLITSANFNLFGLKINNEWGVMVDDEKELEVLANDLFEHVIFQPLTRSLLNAFAKSIDRDPLGKNTQSIGLNLAKVLPLKSNPLNVAPRANFWLKPIGVTGHTIPWGEPRTNIHEELHFAVYPRAVKPGHIILAYAVGHGHFLSVYSVISTVDTTANAADRWHYYVMGENLTPFYGSEWSEHSVTITNQKSEFLAKKMGIITQSGKNSFGSFMRGADKLKITEAFANYVIGKITTINNEIATRIN